MRRVRCAAIKARLVRFLIGVPHFSLVLGEVGILTLILIFPTPDDHPSILSLF